MEVGNGPSLYFLLSLYAKVVLFTLHLLLMGLLLYNKGGPSPAAWMGNRCKRIVSLLYRLDVP